MMGNKGVVGSKNISIKRVCGWNDWGRSKRITAYGGILFLNDRYMSRRINGVCERRRSNADSDSALTQNGEIRPFIQ